MSAVRLSSGQRVLFDAALRVAAAKATGFQLVALDDGNKLGLETRARLLAFLRASGLQVIYCSTTDKVTKKSLAEFSAAYFLENPGITGPSKISLLVDGNK